MVPLRYMNPTRGLPPFALIIGVVVLVVAGWMLFRSSETTSTNSRTATSTESGTGQGANSGQSMSGNLEYKNEKHGFRVVYPRAWKIDTDPEDVPGRDSLVVFTPASGTVKPAMWFWSEFPGAQGSIVSLEGFKSAVSKWGEQIHNALSSGPYNGKVSVVTEGGLEIVWLDLAGEQYAFFLVNGGIVGISAADLLKTRISKI